MLYPLSSDEGTGKTRDKSGEMLFFGKKLMYKVTATSLSGTLKT